MNHYKTILFDWEGVVGPQETRSFGWLTDRLSQEYSVTTKDATAALKSNVDEFMVGAIDNHTFWQRVGDTLRVTFRRDFEEAIWREWPGAMPLPEMKELVNQVKLMGYRTVVFSNVLPPSAACIREQAGYDDFDAEVLSYEVGLKKPDLAIYQKAIEFARCLPKECIFIDDKESNLVPARQIGMTAILSLTSRQVSQELLQLLQ